MMNKLYSQNNEEEVILKIFGESTKGRFLDIGAWNGETFSNTRKLWEIRWSGVCVEPSPSCCDSFLKLYKDDDRITISNVAVVPDNPGWRTFYDAGGDALSTLDTQSVSKWQAQYPEMKFKPYDIFAVSVDQLFGRYGFDFDFINLDVEGTNLDIFKKLPFSKLNKLRCVVVEHDGWYLEMLEFTKEFGFTQSDLNGENLILTKNYRV